MTVTKKKSVPIEEMVAYSAGNDFTILDLETTGLSPLKGGFIIEIGAVRLRNGKVIGQMSQLIDPKQKLYGKTIELTGITNEMVQGKPTYGEVLPKLYELIGDSTIVAHNSMFDWDRFLKYYFNQLGFYPENKSICTKRFFQYLRPERKKLKQKYGLSELTQVYGIPFDEDEHHRALVDTQVTTKAFIKMRREYLQSLSYEDLQSKLTNIQEGSIKQETVEKVQDIEISNIRYWRKVLKSKTIQRVYVHFNYKEQYFGTVYYDVTNACWFVKSFDLPIDFPAVEKQVLKYLKVNSMQTYLKKIKAA